MSDRIDGVLRIHLMSPFWQTGVRRIRPFASPCPARSRTAHVTKTHEQGQRGYGGERLTADISTVHLISIGVPEARTKAPFDARCWRLHMGLHDAIYRAQKDKPELAETEQRILDELTERDRDSEVETVESAA